MSFLALRLERKLTQQEVAKKIGVSRVTLAQYELGYRNPSVGVAKQLADI